MLPKILLEGKIGKQTKPFKKKLQVSLRRSEAKVHNLHEYRASTQRVNKLAIAHLTNAAQNGEAYQPRETG
jgi:hypothetical protein